MTTTAAKTVVIAGALLVVGAGATGDLVVVEAETYRSPMSIVSSSTTVSDFVAREAEWLSYLDRLQRRYPEHGAVVAVAGAFWASLAQALGRIPPHPSADLDSDGTFEAFWEKGRHHFEVEFFDEWQAAWLYHDRTADQWLSGEIADVRAELPREFMDAFSLVS